MITLSSGSQASFRRFSIIQFFKSLRNISRYYDNIKEGCNVVFPTVSALVFSYGEVSNIKYTSPSCFTKTCTQPTQANKQN